MNAPANLPPLSIDASCQKRWAQDQRRLFLESLVEGHPVESACAHVGMSKESAYALRRSDPGFALAWSAASLRARDALADLLMDRAVNGQTETIMRDDGTKVITVTRHRYDNRLALELLRRLDRLAGQPETSELGQPDEAAARGVAQDFDAFVDLVGEGAVDPQAIDDFVEPRIRKLRKLCSADRVEKMDEEEEEAAKPPVWVDALEDVYVTDLPPPPDFDGDQEGMFGLRRYKRTLTEAELDALEFGETGIFADRRAEGLRRHAEWFGAIVGTGQGAACRAQAQCEGA